MPNGPEHGPDARDLRSVLRLLTLFGAAGGGVLVWLSSVRGTWSLAATAGAFALVGSLAFGAARQLDRRAIVPELRPLSATLLLAGTCAALLLPGSAAHLAIVTVLLAATLGTRGTDVGKPWTMGAIVLFSAGQVAGSMLFDHDPMVSGHAGPLLAVSALGVYTIGSYLSGSARRVRDVRALGQVARAKLVRSNTALERARREAEAANRAKSTFLANASHELRTPLNAIIGYSEMLLEDAEEQDAEDLGRINTAAKHLVALISDILDLSKIEAGRMELQLSDFDMRAAMVDVAAAGESLARARKNRLVVDLADAGTVHADPTKIRQIALNLVGNACKFTEDGTVTLRLRSDDSDGVVLTVTDTGIGMTARQQERIFEAFAQAERNTSALYGGTGLGLAIARHMCEMMGGSIQVSSEVGVGSTFTVRLPRTAQQRRVERVETPPEPARVEEHGGTVVLFDTEGQTGEVLRLPLEMVGWKLADTRDDSDATAALASEDAAVIVATIADSPPAPEQHRVVPPNDSGAFDSFHRDIARTLAFLQRARQNPRWEDIPIVVVTGDSISHDVRRQLDEVAHTVAARSRLEGTELVELVTRVALRARRSTLPPPLRGAPA